MSRIEDLIAELCPNGVELKALGELGQLVRGNGMPKTDFTYTGVGAIHYGQIYTHYGTWATETISFVSTETAARLAKVEPGDVIITNTSENLEDVGKAVAWLGNAQIVTGGHATILKHSQNPKFIAYWLQTPSFQAQKKKLATGTKVIDVSAKQLEKVKVPVPPIAVQQEVVQVLDRYSDLQSALESELAKELAARRIQYAYHRDSLLAIGDRGGTAWATLPEIAKNLDSTRKPVTKSARKPGAIPYYGASGVVDYVSDYILDGDYLLVSEDGANLLSRSTPIAFSISGKTWVNNHAHIFEFPTYAERRFAEIYLNSIDLTPFITGDTQPKLNQANLNRIPIPVPPVDERERIVAVIDRYKAHVDDLSASLSAERVARQKQYDFYRDRLLTFEETLA